MTVKIAIAICAAAFVAATIATQLAQAGTKGVSASSPGHKMENATPEPPKGASTFAPGHQLPVAGDPGHSGNAPGDIHQDNPKKK